MEKIINKRKKGRNCKLINFNRIMKINLKINNNNNQIILHKIINIMKNLIKSKKFIKFLLERHYKIYNLMPLTNFDILFFLLLFH